MAVGLSPAKASSILSVYKATAFSAVTPWCKLHVGDPGAAGTANPSGLTTRNQITFGTITSGSMVLSALASYTMNATETITHISIWDAVGPAGGNFMESWALSAGVPVVNGSTLTINTLTLTYSPIAA